jgi:hypothetical protein
MVVLAIIAAIFGVITLIGAIGAFASDCNGLAVFLAILTAVCLILFGIGMTTRIVPNQYVGVVKGAVSQELRGPFEAGMISKPFLGSVHNFPASTQYQRCEKFTPAIKGSYEIAVDLCFYFDLSQVDWREEINRTGSLNANYIMDTWRNSIVRDVAQPFKVYTPEQLASESGAVEAELFDVVNPWFSERGVPLVALTFPNWTFTSQQVQEAFDNSIVAQRKATEQAALLEAAKIARERQLFEVETQNLVAQEQQKAFEALGLDGDQVIEYLWIQFFEGSDEIPDVFIVGAGNPSIAVPVDSGTMRTPSEVQPSETPSE